MYIAYSYCDTALTDTDQEQGAPASGQHGKPRHWNHKYLPRTSSKSTRRAAATKRKVHITPLLPKLLRSALNCLLVGADWAHGHSVRS
jgi:hypothetical protein